MRKTRDDGLLIVDARRTADEVDEREARFAHNGPGKAESDQMAHDAGIVEDEVPVDQSARIDLLEKCVFGLQQSLIRAHRKLIELEADMTAAGIGAAGAAKRSALILPEHMTRN